MPIPSDIDDLSPVPGDNSPAGSESPTEGDNYIRALSAIIRQNYDAYADTASTAAGDALIGVKRTESGAEATTLHFYIQRSQLRLTDFLTSAECDDILAGTGSVDVSTKFQTALTRAAGGVLILPTGRIKADNLTVSGTRTTIVGAGGRSTRISAPTVSNNVFTVSGDFVDIRDLLIDSSVTRSGGWYVDFQSTANRGRLSSFSMDGFHGGVRTAAVATISIERGEMLNGIATNGVGIRINAGFDVSIRDIILDAASQIFAGVYVTATGDLTIEDCNLVHGGQALFLNPQAGQVVASVWANNCYFDTSTRGLYALAQGSGASIVRCVFDQCWFSGNTNEGVRIATSSSGTIEGLDFTTPHIFLNGGDGLFVADTGVSEIHIRNGAVAENTSAGLSFGAGVSDFSVQGVRIGPTHGLGANNVGINISSGAGANLRITDNDLRGNTSATISDGATGTGKLLSDNIGWQSGSATYDPPNLADGAGATTTVTVSEAALGDMVDSVSFSNDLQGITLTAWVSSANTVSVRFQNESGGALDLASGTLRVRLKRST